MKRRKRDRNQDTCRSPGIGRTHHEQRAILPRNSRLKIHSIQATRPPDWYPQREPDRPSPVSGGIIRSRIRVDTDIPVRHLQPSHKLTNHQPRVKTTARIIVEMKVQAATLDNRAPRGIHLYRQPVPPSLDAAPHSAAPVTLPGNRSHHAGAQVLVAMITPSTFSPPASPPAQKLPASSPRSSVMDGSRSAAAGRIVSW